jgi:hypothetical protein
MAQAEQRGIQPRFFLPYGDNRAADFELGITSRHERTKPEPVRGAARGERSKCQSDQ